MVVTKSIKVRLEFISVATELAVHFLFGLEEALALPGHHLRYGKWTVLSLHNSAFFLDDPIEPLLLFA